MEGPGPRGANLTLVAAVMFYSIITQNANALAALGVHDAQRVGVLTMIASLGVPIGTFAYWIASRLRISWLLCLDFALIGIGFFGMGRAVDPGTSGSPRPVAAFSADRRSGR